MLAAVELGEARVGLAKLVLQIFEVKDGIVVRRVVREHPAVAIQNFSANGGHAYPLQGLSPGIILETAGIDNLHEPQTGQQDEQAHAHYAGDDAQPAVFPFQ